MLGAVIGDIIGSQFEFINYTSKNQMFKEFDFHFYTDKCKPTDDTTLTIAVLDCLMNKKPYAETFKEYARKYPLAGYGSSFIQWVDGESMEPYNSYGNGSAMRVSPVAWFFNTRDEVLKAAEESASVTHNHPEGIKGAQAIALAIFLARTGKSKTIIKNSIVNLFGYDLERTLDEIRPTYEFSATCQLTVPESIIAFLESTDFEDCIRRAISIGGDSDTIACMAGGIAEAFYGLENIHADTISGAMAILYQQTPELHKTFISGLLEAHIKKEVQL